ncbi:MAG TPA: HlyD family efflux transporter periplasmic adaptor subunit [Pelobium sp.]|nr:HlyD family efflux transporter periplasmic adaptor subunit [Pelobium sp.]
MRKMWRDSFLDGLGDSRTKNKEQRDMRFGEAIAKSKEQRDLLDGFAWRNSFTDKISLFPRAKSHYSLLTTRYFRLILFLTIISLFACNSNSKKAETSQQYTCPMHPQIIKDKPGSCPICGMDLTPIHNGHHQKNSIDSLTDVPPTTTETFVVKASSYAPEITLNGNVTYNTNNVKSISARVNGRIEKSFVKYNFEPIKKGQLLLKVYSPELVAIQQELLFLKSGNDEQLLNKTKTKLRLLGVSAQQINSILKTGKPDYTINIYSNYSGYLLNPEGGNEQNLQLANNPLNIKEGQYINSGDLLFKVFNNNSLWVEFYINTLESEWLKIGTELELKIGDQSHKTRIAFIQPFFKNNQNYKVIRVVLDNHNHHYKIGELVTGAVKHPAIKGIWIPQQSVYQSGENNLVFIKTANGLKAKEVQISAKADNQLLVKKGLSSGDEIAKNASYLTDSESFINSK